MATITFLVRNWDCKKFKEISADDLEMEEKKAGKVSAFSETRKVINGYVEGTGMSVEEFLNYRNK